MIKHKKALVSLEPGAFFLGNHDFVYFHSCGILHINLVLSDKLNSGSQ